MPPTTAEPVHDRGLGDLLIHRDMLLDGLDAPQHAARTVLAEILDGKAEDQLFDTMLVASDLGTSPEPWASRTLDLVVQRSERCAAHLSSPPICIDDA
ncbi:hypothetical protein ABZ434_34995 [Streptomyces sp. NPDC005761]|uniref:hypothetical protein n=1 Tax=Streptomyces sp. NPDC005761 TaxID=3157066 RepID=UPI0033D7C82E